MAGPSWAQADLVFGSGKPLLPQEQDLDRRFARSRVAQALKRGTDDPNCAQVLGGLLMILAEVGPRLHGRDENFVMDPALLEALNTQLTQPQFPGNAFLTAMVRRVLIDRKLPDEWMRTAEQLNPSLGVIDMGKLRMLQEGLAPIESFFFTLEKLKERHDVEVVRANSVSRTEALAAFKDAYVDRFVAWGDMRLLDISAPRKKKKRKGATDATEPEPLVALLHWRPPAPPAQTPLGMLMRQKRPPPLKVYARLAPRQYLDIAKLPRGKRVLVRGQFWELNKNATEFEIRSAQLYEEREFVPGALLVDPRAVAACPFATNDLTGIAPDQPGGFRHP